MRTVRQISLAASQSESPAAYIPQQFAAPGLSMQQIFSILRAYRKQAALIAVAIVVLTAVVTKLLPKTYTATATMIVSYYQDSKSGIEFPVGMLASYMATQVELMQSPEVLLPVIDRLGLVRDPEFTAGFHGTDQTVLRDWVAKKLLSKLTVDEGRGSQLLYVTAASTSSIKAAAIANAVADVYSEQEKQRLKDPADDRAREYSVQLAELQAKVKAAQEKVTDFRQRTGITVVASPIEGGAAGDLEAQTLASLEQQLLQAQNMVRAAESRDANSAGDSEVVSTSPVIQTLRTDIATQTSELSQLTSVYGPHHPKVVALESQLQQSRRELDQQLRNYASSARQLEAKLQQAVDAQRAKILSIRKQQDEGAKQQLELESAQSVYKRALDGYDQIMFASAGNPTNVTFVSRAAIPLEASAPNKIKFMLAGLVAGMMFGLLVPLVYELVFHRRLRCRDDIERDFGIPVLAQFGSIALPAKAGMA